jgi:hypothetical protein
MLRFFAGLGGVFLVDIYISQHSLLLAKRSFGVAQIKCWMDTKWICIGSILDINWILNAIIIVNS